MDSHFNNSVVASGTKAGAMYEARAAHNRRVSAKLREQDARDVEKLARHLPHVRTARELCRECRVSYDKLDRLLRAYFPGDPVAAQYTKTSRDERENLVKANYRDLRKTMVKEECAKALHMKLGEMNRIIALYGLDRPQSTSATRWNNPGRPATREQAEQA
jgi:DNA-directed RNA polymerase specialized sigma subunit